MVGFGWVIGLGDGWFGVGVVSGVVWQVVSRIVIEIVIVGILRCCSVDSLVK